MTTTTRRTILAGAAALAVPVTLPLAAAIAHPVFMTESEMRAAEFERLLLQLDPRRLRMIGCYMNLLTHNKEFRKMPEERRRALIEEWFEEGGQS